MKFTEIMNELAAHSEMGSVSPDDTGSITLLFDNEHEVTFMPEENGDAVYFQCEIGDASQLGQDGCRSLLEASFSQTDGAAFAIHHELDKVILWKRFGEFSSRSELENAINDFLGLVVAWKKRLASGDLGSGDTSFDQNPSSLLSTANFIQV